MEDEPASEAKDESQAESGAEASNPDQAPNQKAGRPPKPLPRPVESPQQAEPSRGRGKKRKNPTIEAEARASKKRKPLAPAPTNRGPDTKLNKRAESKQPIAGSRSGSIRPNSRSLYEYRGTTPMNDAEHMTRFGRASYKPLNFWAGEKPVIEHGEIKEIIRAEKVATPDRPKSIGNRRGAKAKKRRGGLRNIEEEEEDEADMEDWETQGGILSAQVMQWDSMQNTHIEDEFEEVGKFLLLCLCHCLTVPSNPFTPTCLPTPNQKLRTPPPRSRPAISTAVLLTHHTLAPISNSPNS